MNNDESHSAISKGINWPFIKAYVPDDWNITDGDYTYELLNGIIYTTHVWVTVRLEIHMSCLMALFTPHMYELLNGVIYTTHVLVTVRLEITTSYSYPAKVTRSKLLHEWSFCLNQFIWWPC